jgi:tetratricopeptide (TPR) repeat protein
MNSTLDSSQAKLQRESSYASSAAVSPPAVFPSPPVPSQPNPFELLHQHTSDRSLSSTAETAEDDALAGELANRLQALKARIHLLDSEVLEAEVVPPPTVAPTQPKVINTYPSSSSVGSSGSYPTLGRPTSIIAMQEQERRKQMEEARLLEEKKRQEMEEFREKERQRLQWESEQRAIQQQRESQEAEIRRRQAQQEEFDRLRRNSAVLTSKATPEAKFMILANEKLKSAVVYENNRKFAEAMSEYIKVLGYMQEAFDRNQIMERAENLVRMEGIVEKLSTPPFSNNGTFQGKTGMLAAMGRHGYDLLQRALQIRSQGSLCEQEKNLGGAIRNYKAAVEYFIAYKKFCDAVGKPVDPSVMAAAEELLTHTETLHKLM